MKLIKFILVMAFIVANVTPASASQFATVDTVTISGQSVYITGSGACPALFDVDTVVNSWKVKIYVTQHADPMAGVCPEGTVTPFSETVNVSLSRAKDVYVNDVYYGVMYP